MINFEAPNYPLPRQGLNFQLKLASLSGAGIWQNAASVYVGDTPYVLVTFQPSMVAALTVYGGTEDFTKTSIVNQAFGLIDQMIGDGAGPSGPLSSQMLIRPVGEWLLFAMSGFANPPNDMMSVVPIYDANLPGSNWPFNTGPGFDSLGPGVFNAPVGNTFQYLFNTKRSRYVFSGDFSTAANVNVQLQQEINTLGTWSNIMVWSPPPNTLNPVTLSLQAKPTRIQFVNASGGLLTPNFTLVPV